MAENQNKTESGNARNNALMDSVEQIQDENTRRYIVDRLMPQMEWYSKKGRECQKRYYRWMSASIILGALIPVVSVFADGAVWIKVLLAALGSAVTACNAYAAMRNYKDLWITYRNTREKLLRILYCYFNHAGAFSQEKTQSDKDTLLVNICEEEMSGETSAWSSLMQKVS